MCMEKKHNCIQDEVLEKIQVPITDRIDGFVQDHGLWVFASVALAAVVYMGIAAAYNN